MIIGMHHSGVVVRDMEKALAFYTEVLGLKSLGTAERRGAPISQVVGYENAHLTRTMLATPSGTNVELLQYHSPPPADRPTQERSVLGASHIAFTVDDIEATFQELISRGARKLNPPVEVEPGRKVTYLQDPDGNWIELLQIAE